MLRYFEYNNQYLKYLQKYELPNYNINSNRKCVSKKDHITEDTYKNKYSKLCLVKIINKQDRCISAQQSMWSNILQNITKQNGRTKRLFNFKTIFFNKTRPFFNELTMYVR